MRAICRKLLRQLQQHNSNEGIAARKQVRIILDRNDVYDLKHYIDASNCSFSTLAGAANKSYTAADIRHLFKPTEAQTHQIAAYWASSSMDSKDSALGAILGAFVGDAAGGVLEFMENVTAEQVSVLSMVGVPAPAQHLTPAEPHSDVYPNCCIKKEHAHVRL